MVPNIIIQRVNAEQIYSNESKVLSMMKFISFFGLKRLILILSLLLLKACASSDVAGENNSEAMRLSSQVKSLQDLIETLQSDYNDLKKESQQQTEILNQGQTKVNNLESDIRDLKSKNQQQTQELNETQKKLDNLNDSNEISSNTNKSLSDRLKILEAELMEAKDQVDDLTKQNQELLTINLFGDELKSELEATTEELREANNQIKKLEAIVTELQKTLKLSDPNYVTGNLETEIKNGWYETIRVKEIEIDKENPRNSRTGTFREVTKGPYWFVEDGKIKIRGNYTEGLNSIDFLNGLPLPSAFGKLTSEDYIIFDDNPTYKWICYIRQDYSGCEKTETVSMNEEAPILVVENGIQFSYIELNYYSGTEIYSKEQVYISRWVGEAIGDLPHHTELNYDSDEGFFGDPVYSKIKKNDFDSYLNAFIEDAERHGVDLSDIDLQNYDFQIKEELPGFVDASAGSLCNDQIRVYIQERLWDNQPQFDLYHKMIYVMWHMFGHTILGLDHTCDPYNIMWNYQSSCAYDVPPSYPDIFRWDHADPKNNWQRAVKDMFSGYKQTKFDCENTLEDKSEILCLFPALPKVFF